MSGTRLRLKRGRRQGYLRLLLVIPLLRRWLGRKKIMRGLSSVSRNMPSLHRKCWIKVLPSMDLRLH
jgi:hypothetical protein